VEQIPRKKRVWIRSVLLQIAGYIGCDWSLVGYVCILPIQFLCRYARKGEKSGAKKILQIRMIRIEGKTYRIIFNDKSCLFNQLMLQSDPHGVHIVFCV